VTTKWKKEANTNEENRSWATRTTHKTEEKPRCSYWTQLRCLTDTVLFWDYYPTQRRITIYIKIKPVTPMLLFNIDWLFVTSLTIFGFFIGICIVKVWKWRLQLNTWFNSFFVSRIRISKKNRQHNSQKKKYKRINNDH
jgi:hypothetical protein